MDQKQIGKIKKRIKEIEKSLETIDQEGTSKNVIMQRLQNEINLLMQRRLSILGGAIELNRLLPKEHQIKKYIPTKEEEKPEEAPLDESPKS